jgi:hypothetical protein
MLTRRTEAFRQTAELVEQLCADQGLVLDASTVDAAVRVRVATVARSMDVTQRALN